MFRLIFGLIFSLVMATAAAAQNAYKVQPGDTLQMEVLEDPAMNRNLLVLPDGTVSVPLMGTIKASGQTVDSISGTIADGLAKNFAARPTVFLSVAQLSQPGAGGAGGARASKATMPVYIMGEVANPGMILVEPGTTLLQFLATSGGLTKFASTKRVQLRRTDKNTGQEQVFNYNYHAVLAGASAPSIVMKKGDVVIVPERKLFE